MVNRWIKLIQRMRPKGRCLLCDSPQETLLGLCASCDARLTRVKNPCTQCGEALPPASPTEKCGSCIARPPYFDRCLAPLAYAAASRELHTRFKFQQHLAAGKALATLLAMHLQQHASPFPELIIPVPLHAKRMRQRGFDQALEIAKVVSHHLTIPINAKLLHRHIATPPQSGLHRTARQKNLNRAFVIEGNLPARHIALVDDVMTTGSTLNAAAKVCKQHGAEKVDIWVISRTLRKP